MMRNHEVSWQPCGIPRATVVGVGVVEPDRAADPRDSGWFDHRRELGRGYKYLPRAAQYALAATRRAVHEAGGELEGVSPERRGICMGTNNAVSVLQGDIDRTIEDKGSHVLSPASSPYFSINLVGSRVAMEHDMKGFSLGFHTPRTSGIEAVQGAVRALADGRADIVIVGAAECALDSTESDVAGQDGAVILVLRTDESRSRPTIAARSLFMPPAVRDTVVADQDLNRVLDSLAVESPTTDVTLTGPDCEVTSTVRRLLDREWTPAVEFTPTGTAGSFDAMRSLARLTDEPLAGRSRLLVATSEYGNVAVAVVR